MLSGEDGGKTVERWVCGPDFQQANIIILLIIITILMAIITIIITLMIIIPIITICGFLWSRFPAGPPGPWPGYP
jgi:putative flippase GtrA